MLAVTSVWFLQCVALLGSGHDPALAVAALAVQQGGGLPEDVSFASGKPLRLAKPEAPAGPVLQYGRVELRLGLEATYVNPFDPAEINVEATFTGPGGKEWRVPGFLYVPYERTTQDNREVLTRTGEPEWRVRFTPTVPGAHSCVVRATDKSGTVATEPVTFTVAPSKSAGFVRRSEKSPYYLRFDSGDSYFAVGQNVCWGGDRQTLDYERWFPAMGRAGANYARIWLVRWNMALEWTRGDGRGRYYGLGLYSPDNAWRLDHVMDLAAENGIRVMLCLGYHGEVMDSKGYFGEDCWAQNPYNAANAGPCAKPADFWTDPKARELYKHRLRYYVARWGASPYVLSFEFWNEVNAPAAWIAEMSAYLHGIDPFGHLLTTTYGDDDVWRVPTIDYTQTHTYGTDDTRHDCVEAVVADCRGETERLRKPHLVGEFGIDWKTSDTQHDPKGHATNLHNGLWAAMASRSMGGASVWYWDGYVDPLNLYSEFTALSRFAADVPWADLDPEIAKTTAPERTPGADDAWGGVDVRPTLGWGKSTGAEFTIGPEGTVTGDGGFSSFLYSEAKPDLRVPLRFHVTCPKGGALTFRVGNVCTLAKPQVTVDGNPVWEREFKAGPEGQGDYRSTEFRQEFNIWISLFDQECRVDLPAGSHTIGITNEAGDWAEVSGYRFEGCVDPRFATGLEVFGIRAADLAILWAHNRASNWFNRSHDVAVESTPQTVRFDLLGLSDGSYTVEWYDTRTGEAARREAAESTGGRMTLRPGPVSADTACKIRRRAG